jgi:hypothetical protein
MRKGDEGEEWRMRRKEGIYAEEVTEVTPQ